MMPLPKMSAYRSWIAPYNYVQNMDQAQKLCVDLV
jgi:hypothetical protein